MLNNYIHLFWGGDKPFPGTYINSLKKVYPGYQIRVWKPEELPQTDNVLWCIKNKQWSVLSDFCRHWAVYHWGGMYIDTDMEAVRPITDILKPCAWFSGLEVPKYCNAALSGGDPGNGISKEMMKQWLATDWCETYLNQYAGIIPIASAAGPFLQTKVLNRILPECKQLSKVQHGYHNGMIQLISERIAFGSGYREYHRGAKPHPEAVFIHHWEKSGR